MTKIIAMLLAVALAGFGLMWAGHHRGYGDGVAATQKTADRKVDAAKAATDLAIAERDAARQTLENARQTLAAQKRRMEVANFYADAALAESTTLRKQLKAASAARDTALRKAAHDSPDCADLARLPVCPAVAERLWPRAAAADARH